MPNNTRIKMCGLSTLEEIKVAKAVRAAYIGFVFFPKSPRYLTIEQAAPLAMATPVGICKVALVVDAEDTYLDALLDKVPLDMLQLHGAETPERVLDIKKRFGLPVMKAVGVADATDLAVLETYNKVADQILVDAKPPKDAPLPGGNGLAFDWRLIAGLRWPIPWMLAGGLNPENVAEALRMTGAQQVDVSSGLESAPGVKDAGKMRKFAEQVRNA